MTINNTKMYQLDKHMNTVPRVWRRKARRKQSARLLVKCGCCDRQFKVYHSTDTNDLLDDLVEINGVCASREQWRAIFKEVGIL